MNSKRILMIFVLFALLIATTSVAFASENVDTSIDDGNVIGDIDNGVDQSDDDENWPYYDDDGYLFNEKVDYIEGDDDGADDSNDLDDEDNLDDSDDEDWEDYDDEDDLDDSDDEDWEDYDDSDDLDDEDWEDYDDYNLDDSDNPVTDDWTVYEGEDAFYNSSAHIKYLDKTYYSKDYSDGNGSGYKFVEEWDEEYEDGTVVHIYRTTAYANGAKTVASSCTYLGNTHNDTSNDTSDKNEGACDDASNDVVEKAPASMAAGASPIDDNAVSVSKSIATASSLLDDNNQQQDQNTSANTTNKKSNDVEIIQENDDDLLSIFGFILAILISIIVIL